MADKAPTVLITGAAGGIGSALVATFAEAGYRVVATDRVQTLDRNDRVFRLPIDLELFVNDSSYADSAIVELSKLIGDQGLNVLINNAAIQVLGGVDTLSREDWRKSLDVNLMAPFLLTQALLRPLEQAFGCVVHISSIHARLTKKNFVAYATTKAALSGLTRAMAVDLGDRVRINAIEPAAIQTPMLMAGFSERADAYRELELCHPQMRIGTPQEVADAALVIADSRARFLHGTCVSLDGGISARLHDPG